MLTRLVVSNNYFFCDDLRSFLILMSLTQVRALYSSYCKWTFLFGCITNTPMHMYIQRDTVFTMCCWIDRKAECEGCVPNSFDDVVGNTVGAFRETLLGP